MADILAPHEEYEEEAEAAYREALTLAPNHGPAQEALGRLLARQGRLEDAVEPLAASSRNPALPGAKAAENAAICARALLELNRIDEAESLLKAALQRTPDSQRALLELARLYERTARATEQAIVLESLSELPVSSMLAAEVSYRRAALLLPAAQRDPFSSEAERARAYLLEAVSSDAKHVAARVALVQLARDRLEWSVVAHMHYLAIRDLPPGPSRAKTHLDLAETYLDHLEDPQSAARNVESALQQAPNELAVVTRAGQLAARLPDAARVAERFESIAANATDLEDGARARLWLLAADLRMSEDDVAAAEAASQRVLDLRSAPSGAVAAAQRNLDTLGRDEARDLRQQKSGLLRLLEDEPSASERAHLLGRLRDVGVGLGDRELVERVSREQLESPELTDEQFEAALSALREALAERGAHEALVDLFIRLAADAAPDRASVLLQEAAAFAWTGLGDAHRAAEVLEQAMKVDPQRSGVYRRIGEIADASGAGDVRQRLLAALEQIPPDRRTPATNLHTAVLAIRCGRTQDGVAMLRPLTVQRDDHAVRLRSLRELDAVLDATATDADRLPVLRRRFDEALSQDGDDVLAIAGDLVRIEMAHGHLDRALATCDLAIDHETATLELLRLRITVLERLERWEKAAHAREALASQLPDLGLRARELEAAARLWLDHESTDPSARRRDHAVGQARRLLLAACTAAPDLPSVRGTLLPVEFAARRWDSVLRLGIELRELTGDEDPRLILAGLTQAFRYGQRSLAKDLGSRYSAEDRARYLFPGLRQLLTEVAMSGPLPRLDSVLAAGAASCGGRRELDHAMRSWAAGKPLQAGVALGLARLSEADGRANLARSLYQLTAFMVPDGPVPAVAGRLPLALPPVDLTAGDRGPLGRGSALRLALLRARDTLAGLEDPRGRSRASGTTRFALADTIVEPLRRHLGLPLPLRFDPDAGQTAISVAATAPPSIVVGPAVEKLSVAELRFRLARGATTIAMGLSAVASGRVPLVDLLDGLMRMASPGHEATRKGARGIADRVSRDGLHRRLTPPERQALASELSHWLSREDEPAPLRAELDRFVLWFATRLSGQLDGALSYLARDFGTLLNTGTPDPVATLRTEAAQWLLRGLELYSPR